MTSMALRRMVSSKPRRTLSSMPSTSIFRNRYGRRPATHRSTGLFFRGTAVRWRARYRLVDPPAPRLARSRMLIAMTPFVVSTSATRLWRIPRAPGCWLHSWDLLAEQPAPGIDTTQWFFEGRHRAACLHGSRTRVKRGSRTGSGAAGRWAGWRPRRFVPQNR